MSDIGFARYVMSDGRLRSNIIANLTECVEMQVLSMVFISGNVRDGRSLKFYRKSAKKCLNFKAYEFQRTDSAVAAGL